jgi:hypothetical protein
LMEWQPVSHYWLWPTAEMLERLHIIVEIPARMLRLRLVVQTADSLRIAIHQGPWHLDGQSQLRYEPGDCMRRLS